jgi:hypothetical protein
MPQPEPCGNKERITIAELISSGLRKASVIESHWNRIFMIAGMDINHRAHRERGGKKDGGGLVWF